MYGFVTYNYTVAMLFTVSEERKFPRDTKTFETATDMSWIKIKIQIARPALSQ